MLCQAAAALGEVLMFLRSVVRYFPFSFLGQVLFSVSSTFRMSESYLRYQAGCYLAGQIHP